MLVLHQSIKLFFEMTSFMICVGMTRHHKKDPSFHLYHPSVSALCMSKGPSVEVGSTEKVWNEIKALDNILPCAMATS